MFGDPLSRGQNEPLIYSIKELLGNGLQKLEWVADSATITRRFKSRLVACGIYRPVFVDKAKLNWTTEVVHRYDPAVPNKRFKYLYVKEHGTPKGLSSLKKERVELRKVTSYTDQSRSVNRVFKPHPRLPGAVVKPFSWHDRKGTVSNRFRKLFLRGESKQDYKALMDSCNAKSIDDERVILKAFRNRPKAMRVQNTGSELIRSTVGGTNTLVPMRHHKKYWYFLRKRGTWAFSVHHPYGDEMEYFHHIKELSS